MIEILEVSIDPSLFVDGRQIGSVKYRNGNVDLLAKVIKGNDGSVFCKHPSAFRRGIYVDVVRYPSREDWQLIEDQLLRRFREVVGDSYIAASIQDGSQGSKETSSR